MKTLIRKLITLPVRLLNRYEYNRQRFSAVNERTVEYLFLFRKLAETRPKTILDVGSGQTALPSLLRHCGYKVTAIDNVSDYWRSGMENRHFHVIKDDITNTQLTDTFDFICCISTLEHIKDYKKAVKNMVGLLNPGGHLLLTFPFSYSNYIENVYKLSKPDTYKKVGYVTQSFSRESILFWVNENNISFYDYEYYKFWSGYFWSDGERIKPEKCTHITADLCCILFRKPNK
jgi:2-polyprenyl-3-methyl-5-hydroxy-6-metoxy-1,4-benzoquinol methylase